MNQKNPLEFHFSLDRKNLRTTTNSNHSEILKSIVIGYIDGAVVTFSLICACVGYQLPIGHLLIIIFSNLLADSIAMLINDYSTFREIDKYETTIKNEQMRISEDYPEISRQELIDIYKLKGIDENTSKRMVLILSKYQDIFKETILSEKYAIQKSEGSDHSNLKVIVSFLSHILFGYLPLLGFIGSKKSELASLDYGFGVACALFVLLLFVMGSIKAHVGKGVWWRSGLVHIIYGSVLSVAAFFIGYAFKNV